MRKIKVQYIKDNNLNRATFIIKNHSVVLLMEGGALYLGQCMIDESLLDFIFRNPRDVEIGNVCYFSSKRTIFIKGRSHDITIENVVSITCTNK